MIGGTVAPVAQRDPLVPFATAAACVLVIFVVYLLVQGHLLDPYLFYTPWHHDDFSALTSEPQYFFWVPRPVSTNFIYMFCPKGAGLYYLLLALLWTAAMSTTLFFIVEALEIDLTTLEVVLFAVAGSFLWHAQGPSVESFQYLGLVTNIVSYFLGISAALVFLAMRRVPMSWAYLGWACAFAILVLASAFAKEDMGLFLGLVVLWSAALRHGSTLSRLQHGVFGLAVVAFAYGASGLHSLAVQSPFVGGEGPYDTSGFMTNIPVNLAFYLTASPATQMLYTFFAFVVLGSGALAIFLAPLRPVFFGSAFLLLCSLALMAPYLILPRHFDYYAMNFMPVLAFAAAPVMVKAARAFPPLAGNRLVPLGAFVLALAGGFQLLHADAVRLTSKLAWMRNVRTDSFRQIMEVRRAIDREIDACKIVAVSGVDSRFGPFLANNGRFLNRLVGRDTAWIVKTAPGSFLNVWGKDRPVHALPWLYATNDSAIPASACRLDFDPKTLRASFTPGQG